MSIIDRLRRMLPLRKQPHVEVTGFGPSLVITGSEADLDDFLRRLVQYAPERDTFIEGMRAARAGGIKPPDDASADGWSWDAWAKEAAAMSFPGWSACRFAHRASPPGRPDAARFVFGVTRGPFGMWQQPFDVCGQGDDGAWKQERATLTCLTHLPTGMGLGIFKSKDYAALAADTAMRTCPNWPDLAEYGTAEGTPWVQTITRTCNAWASLGITRADNAHAHDPSTGTGPYAIMGLADNLESQKPEKLS